MQLEFHQLERRWEHLRVRHPARQRRLLVSLAEVGQQTPIGVVSVEVLPEAIQQQVREGKILAQVALKFLVPVARQRLEDCQRMAAIFSEHHCDTREAGQMYAAWRKGSPAIRKRILDDPALFFKT